MKTMYRYSVLGALAIGWGVQRGYAEFSFTSLHNDVVWTSSAASAVSGDGTHVAGGFYLSPDDRYAHRWNRVAGGEGYLELLPGGFPFSWSGGISFDGAVAVGTAYSPQWNFQRQAVRWTQDNAVEGLGYLPGDDRSSATGVSADGTVVVGISSTATVGQAFRWTPTDEMVGLGGLDGSGLGSLARAVSGDGSVVVGIAQSASGSEAFRWTQEDGMVALGDLAGGDYSSQAFGVSADGSVAVGFATSTSGWQAVRWTEDGLLTLGIDAGTSDAFDASADGSVIVGSSSSLGAFVWEEESGARSLVDILSEGGVDMTGWDLQFATEISDDGTVIVGEAVFNGRREAYVAVIPEPGTVGLMGIGSFILFFTRRSRRRRQSGKIVIPLKTHDCTCNTFIPAESRAEPTSRYSFWDLLDTLDRAAARTKQKALQCFDAFLALIMK